MQIRGKIFTIIGIVLLFGYFIKDSFRDSYDPSQVVMVGNDTLGRDWGAMAEQAALLKQKMLNGNPEENNESQSSGEYKSGADSTLSISSEDPYSKQKFNQENYSSIQSPDGREIITGYSRPEEQEIQEGSDNTQNVQSRIKTRHQKERPQIEEPSMIYRE